MHKTRNDIFDRQALTGYKQWSALCRSVLLFEFTPKTYRFNPMELPGCQANNVLRNGQNCNQVTLRINCPLILRNFTPFWRVTSLSERTQILKKNKTKQKDIQVNSKNQIL